MMKSYLLGIDIGTSACKVAVFDRNGKFLQQPVVIIRYIIHMRDGQSRILRNGGMQSAGQQRKPYRRQISLQMRLQESGSMVRAGLQSQLTERETCWPIHQSGWIREHSLFVTD